ncbi:MAG: hypothetical protein SVY53_12100 [Chloroflexota bacterium]|nr:hypothetical protein [Chloroflexota bacterium]
MPEKSDHDLLVEMHTVLLGSEEAPGLVKQVRQCKHDCDTSISSLRKCLQEFKLRVALLIGFLAGLGILELLLLQ